MPPIRPILELIKKPLQMAGRVGRAGEMAFSSVIHPEQILSKSPILKELYNITVKESRINRITTEF